MGLWRARGWLSTTRWEGIAWDWQSVDGAMVKSSAMECVGARPDGSGKGRKRSCSVDGRGVPLSLVASGANVHDVKLLAATLDQE